MDFTADEGHDEIRQAVRELCAGFPAAYWRGLEPSTYPEEFVETLTEQGWLAVLIPEEFGGAGLGLTAASIVLEEINASGGNAAACHAQMYTMGTILRHGSIEQKSHFLPKIASGDLRLQAFGVTEPTVGSDTTNIKTIATRVGDGYVVRGQKIWTSRAEHSDLMLLLARTTPADEVEKKTEGLSVFVVDMKAAGDALSIRPIKTIMNHATTEVFIDDAGISRHHARITITAGGALLEDLGSKNGTMLNGSRVPGPTPLADGAAIVLGATVLKFRTFGAPGSTETLTVQGAEEKNEL